ncbi:MAG: enoyl-CoA hydratase/isomerase family protein [Hahellaceae bacterium]|nr:enoyl-CoA hydratase/isomerase family protein [Hahellaceae bacterium]MCP5212549.1 enoyl-CoA hydratase/isomerase family protein [Hahellaceae bacterium]
MFEDVTLREEGQVSIVEINRPTKLNAIRIQTYRDIIAALKAADGSADTSVIIITGAGGKFTAGNDLADLIGEQSKQVMGCVQDIFDTLNQLEKPLIAAVEGVAVGIGTTLLLHCDLAVAGAGTKFRLPFANLGVCPEGASSALLPPAIGSKQANELLLTGRFFSADEAAVWGLINRVVDKGQALAGAMEYAQAMLQQPKLSLMATKDIIRQHRGVDVGAIVKNELNTFVALLEDDETQMRISAMLDR